MRNLVIAVLAVTALLYPLAATAQPLASYTQNFESLVQSDLDALANDGWLVYGNVYDTDGTTFKYGYGAFPAPNNGAAFCQIAIGEGGLEQGAQQLVVFNDYENTDHALGYFIESNVFQEQPIGIENVGETWVFEFDAKLGNLEGLSTALAFIKTIDPGNGYETTNFISSDMTAIPSTWNHYSLSITIDAGLVGQLMQFGYSNTATLYQGSGVFYDNITFHLDNATGTTPVRASVDAILRQNYPNPFNPSTSIEFSLNQAQSVELSVFDMAGRRVATLLKGTLGAGD
ncbi:MAG TPA: hypothetical protein VKA63_01705, partial [Candidatus Krumholzibacteria bacterium]|nr:hypothetical protein [Candidatus Krumholzibacteria bacterium]